MTNEERDKAIRILQWLHDNTFLFRSTEEDVKYATKLAIQVLLQEPSGDAVSRQAVDEIKELMTDINGDTVYVVRMSDIRQLPPVTPQPKTGYISIDDVMSVFDDFMCGEVDEDGTDTFLEMLKDKAESEE